MKEYRPYGLFLGKGIIKEKTIDDVYTNRSIRLKLLGYKNYKDYLLSDEWKQIKKTASKKEYYKKCRICKSSDTINLHHSTYMYIGTKYKMYGLKPICKKCHDNLHKAHKHEGRTLNGMTIKSIMHSSVPKLCQQKLF